MINAYKLAQEQYAQLGVDAEAAMQKLAGISISLHCWQGDDVGGFENTAGPSGGIQATGNYPGKARNPDELRADLDKTLSLIPGKHRVNLHAIYLETGGKKVDRDQITPEHFARWTNWAKSKKLGLDFNPTFFSHPLAAEGFTLSADDEGVRQFWIRHAQACRRIAANFGKELHTPAVTNHWVPDGYKDTPADRAAPRARLEKSLDQVFSEKLPADQNLDALEGKLFGIGLESYTVGSHEFYLGYAAKHQKLLCLDSGHYHPTESTADKISAVLLHVPEILLHVSRGIRWDSDHAVTLTDELREIAQELIRGDFLSRTHIGLDFFDASINRIAAWVIGTRAMQKALLLALLEPTAQLKTFEENGDLTSRLGLLEETKLLPAGTIWNEHCLRNNVPPAHHWMEAVRDYEEKVLAKR